MSYQRGRDQFEKYKGVLNALAIFLNILPRCYRRCLWEGFRYTKGRKGLAIRYILLKTLAKQCGSNVSVHPGVYLFHPENLTVGNNVSIHPMFYFECGVDKSHGLTIGNNVSIAHGVTLMTTTHIYSDLTKPVKDQGTEENRIVIEEDSWIGAKATVLCGKIVGKGCIERANSVVTHSLESMGIYARVPARRIGDRS